MSKLRNRPDLAQRRYSCLVFLLEPFGKKLVAGVVTKKRIGNKIVFLCDICGLGYADKATAQECEDYCRSHKGSCSAEISQKAVYLPGASMLPERK